MLLNKDGIAKDWRGLDAINANMARAAITSEDTQFCAHDGFERAAIEDAWHRHRRGGRIRGGSTISQQTAKNAFLWQGGGFFRNGLEAWFTVLVETLWSKQRVMEVYLNIAETGLGTYGVEAASQRYFGPGADRLSTTEAARIAAVLPLPKKRGAIAPIGFTRRYGNSIRARRVVQRNGLDECLNLAEFGIELADKPPERQRRPGRNPAAALDVLAPREVPVPEPVEEPIIIESDPVAEELEPDEPALQEPVARAEEPPL